MSSIPAPLEPEELLNIFLSRHEYSREQLTKVGVLTMAWAVFEHELELTLWEMGAPVVSGAIPATDRLTPTQRIDEFTKLAQPLLDPNWLPSIEAFAEIAKKVAEYRNAIAHGYPAGVSFGALSRANFSWVGELRRKPPKTGKVDDQTLDVMLGALNVLIQALYRGRGCDGVLGVMAITAYAFQSEALHAIRALNVSGTP
ncbi:hypothetical protein [Bosea sp. 685]|uniref:hypothetical protein n=1 Tax=Bosea sp. 685 TaxID=3080057 RepID=UPI0028933F4B|nr:hypothetical protein [Bosea sp. 685]WNJ89146.1 hypothetical protein RMR04_22405 [Bosea sp. 685]